MKPSATASSSRKSPVRRSVTRALHALFAPRSPQTPSHPDASPRSDRFRCGGRESNFLAAKLDGTLKDGDTGKKPDDAAPKAGPTWTNAAGRVALSFDGVDDIVEFPTTMENFKLPFSISFWVNPAAQNGELFGNHPPGMVMKWDGREVQFGYATTGGWAGMGTAPLTAGQWQHVAVVCDVEKSFCYVNGVEKTSAATGKGDFDPNLDLTFRLGQGYQTGRFFRGLLSDFRIYRSALSPSEVQTVMKEGAREREE